MPERHARRALVAGVLLLVLAPARAQGQGLALEAVPFASSLNRPILVTDAGDGSGRTFIGQQTGQILIHDGSSVLSTPFLDISAKLVCCGELGLLGLAFHPQYPVTPYFYVAYTEVTRNDDLAFDLIVARYRVSAADPNVADAGSELILLDVSQPFTNHNGGHLAFGPHGHLYIGTGDGGDVGDPLGNGQDLDTLLGKVLRIDVDSTPPEGRNYAIPAGNPFANDSPAGCMESKLQEPFGSTCDEVWAYGLRNPWRFSFDRKTDDLYLGDVGQDAWEEIDFQPAASTGGENYGWKVLEGTHCFSPMVGCTPPAGNVLPILEYPHQGVFCSGSVTGGFVYRGSQYPQLDGVYLYADFCKGTIWGTVPRCDAMWESQVLLPSSFSISTFGEDSAGELLVADLLTNVGAVYRLGLAAGSGGPNLVISPMPIDFGSPPVGSLEVTLTNSNGGVEALKLEGLALAAGSDFGLDVNGGSAACASSSPCLPPGESCTVELTFSGSGSAWFLDTLRTPGNAPPMTLPIGVCTAEDDPVVSETVSGETKTFDGCNSVTTGSGFLVTTTAKAILRGGDWVALSSGTTIAGELEVHVDLP